MPRGEAARRGDVSSRILTRSAADNVVKAVSGLSFIFRASDRCALGSSCFRRGHGIGAFRFGWASPSPLSWLAILCAFWSPWPSSI